MHTQIFRSKFYVTNSNAKFSQNMTDNKLVGFMNQI